MNKTTIFLFCVIVNSTSMLEAMTMSMKCSVAEKKEITDQDIRASKKIIRKIVKETREADALLQAINEKHLDSSMLHDNETCAFARAICYEESGLIEACLKAGADPNYYNGSDRPLEKVERLKNIELLLQHKADPKLCKQSPLIKSLMYYILRTDKEKSPQRRGWSNERENYYARCAQEKNRLAEKALKCIKLLLRSRASADQDAPLRAIVKLTEDNYLSRQKAKEMVKALVTHGANPDLARVKNYLANSHNYVYDFHKSARHELALYMQEERQKYQAVRQLLIGHKDPNSPLKSLPKDIFKQIGILVKNGFAFGQSITPKKKAKSLEKSVEPERIEGVTVHPVKILKREKSGEEYEKKNEENKGTIDNEQKKSPTKKPVVESINTVPIVQAKTNVSSESPKKQNESVPLDTKNLLPKKKERLPDESIFFNNPSRSFAIVRRNLPLFVIAAGTIACWVYAKWKENKEESEDDEDASDFSKRYTTFYPHSPK